MAPKRKSTESAATRESPASKRAQIEDDSLYEITESLATVQGAAMLMSMACKERGQQWQKPEEVKRAEGSGKLPEGKCKLDQLIAAGMIQEHQWWAERAAARKAETKPEKDK